MKVFLDIDGVLADFHKGILQLYNLTQQEFRKKVSAGEFWWDKYIDKDLMNKLDSDFWTNLQKTSDGDQIINLLENEFGQENICLLNNHVNIPEYASGKIQWINKYYARYGHQYLLGTNKYFVAHQRIILIDDADHNIDDFVKHGGNGILIPRYWNSLYYIIDQGFDIVQYLKLRLKRLLI